MLSDLADIRRAVVDRRAIHERDLIVRWIRQVIDLLGQVAQAVDPADPMRDTARFAADLVNRGVVAYSSSV